MKYSEKVIITFKLPFEPAAAESAESESSSGHSSSIELAG